MKKPTIIIAGAALLLASCTSQGGGSVSLSDGSDSISYAVGMYMAQDIQQVAFEQLKVDKEHVDEFIRGIRAAYPAGNSSKELAYAYGQYIGAQSELMLSRAQKMLYGSDTTKSIDRRLFIEAIVASVEGNEGTMSVHDAVSHYNRFKYRDASEQFMVDNAKRVGVVTLPDGLQYKIDTAGSGSPAAPEDTVCCIYKGTFVNGRSFDSSRGLIKKMTPASLVSGLGKALTILPKGTKAKVYVPWQLGYGAEGNSYVEPYSTLVYDIEIVDIIRKK